MFINHCGEGDNYAKDSEVVRIDIHKVFYALVSAEDVTESHMVFFPYILAMACVQFQQRTKLNYKLLYCLINIWNTS